jgi:hypothetical protein
VFVINRAFTLDYRVEAWGLADLVAQTAEGMGVALHHVAGNMAGSSVAETRQSAAALRASVKELGPLVNKLRETQDQ